MCPYYDELYVSSNMSVLKLIKKVINHNNIFSLSCYINDYLDCSITNTLSIKGNFKNFWRSKRINSEITTMYYVYKDLEIRNYCTQFKLIVE